MIMTDDGVLGRQDALVREFVGGPSGVCHRLLIGERLVDVNLNELNHTSASHVLPSVSVGKSAKGAACAGSSQQAAGK